MPGISTVICFALDVFFPLWCTTNESRLISKFCDAYIALLANDNPYEHHALFIELVADIAKRTIEVKPERKVDRKLPRKKKFSDRRKRSIR